MLRSALLLAAGLAALPAEPPTAVPNWSAPPYWTPPAAAPTSGTRETDGAADPQAIPTSPLVLVGIAPCRIVDTRGTPGVPYNTGGKMVAGESRSYDLNSAPAPCNGIPAGAEAFSVNLTATEPEGPGFLSAFPTGPVPNPLTSLLNYATSENVANATVVPADANGAITILTSTRTHVIVDINGYYAPQSVVNTLNGLAGAVAITAGANVTVTPSGQNVQVSAGPLVSSLAGGTGALTLSGTNGITASRVGQAITVTSDATSDATPSTIASRDASGLLKSRGLDVGGLQSSSNLVFSSGTRFLHRTGGSIFLGSNAGNLTTTCITCIAIGDNALQSVTNFSQQIAIGDNALKSLTTLSGNIAIGDGAIDLMTAGASNVGVGVNVLGNASGGSFNTAVGGEALASLTSGNDNVAIGNLAGTNVTSGDNNIYIGRGTGLAASGSESNTIRIGNVTTAGSATAHTSVFFGGIFNQTSASGINVLINSSGRLGTPTSSRRFKTEIEDVGDRSEVLARLRPVTFLYRDELDPERVRQYGLVAEEVAEVAPDLVVLGEDGRPETVRYHFLVPLLLDALQRQQRLGEAQQRQIEELRREVEALKTPAR